MEGTMRERGAKVRPPRISFLLLFLFRIIVRRYLRKGFHGVRLRGGEHLAPHTGPLIVMMNHSSWWDPMTCFLLALRYMPSRSHFAPMEAKSLKRYGVLAHLGVFPVELGSARGAVQFLRTAEAVLRSGGVLWVTPQGRFVDARERPLQLQGGLASLIARIGECTVIPLAIEYTFWDERKPELLIEAGAPLLLRGETVEALERELPIALEHAMDRLRERALSRDPQSFPRTLLRGRVGVGGFYGIGQRLRAWSTGRRYRPEHRQASAPAGVRE